MVYRLLKEIVTHAVRDDRDLDTALRLPCLHGALLVPAQVVVQRRQDLGQFVGRASGIEPVRVVSDLQPIRWPCEEDTQTERRPTGIQRRRDLTIAPGRLCPGGVVALDEQRHVLLTGVIGGVLDKWKRIGGVAQFIAKACRRSILPGRESVESPA